MHENQPEPDPETFWGWVASLDPALSAYANRPQHTKAEHHAWLMGQWAGGWYAVWEMSKYLDRGTDPLHLLAMFIHTQRALLRRRTPRDFAEALEHARAQSEQDGEWRQFAIAEGTRLDAEAEALLAETDALRKEREWFPAPSSADPFLRKINDSPDGDGATR
jgi:hypothetical protein